MLRPPAVRVSTVFLCVSVLLAVYSVQPAGASGIYQVTDLGDLRPSGISDSGTVVGNVQTDANSWPRQGAVYDSTTGTTTPLSPGVNDPVISPNGTMAYQKNWLATLKNADGTDTSLGTVPIQQMNVYGSGGGHSTPTGVSDNGVVAGESYAGNRANHAFASSNGPSYDYPSQTWKTGVRTMDLGPGMNGQSSAMSVSGNGRVVGWFESRTSNSIGYSHAFLDSTGGDLGTLGGKDSVALGVNNQGAVVGASTLSNPAFDPNRPDVPYTEAGIHAFLSEGRTMKDLGTLSGLKFSFATAIDNQGSVVGTATDSLQILSLLSFTRDGVSGYWGNTARAFIYSNGTMTDLNSLLADGTGWMINSAAAINDSGQIVGVGTLDGKAHGYLLTPLDPAPIPEPASWMAFATIAAFGLGRHRLRRSPPVSP